VEVGGFEAIAIHKTKASNTCSSQVTDHRNSEAAAADDKDSTGAEFGLAAGANFF